MCTTPGPASGNAARANFSPNMAYIGWGVYVMARVDGDAQRTRAWSAAAHLGGKDLSLWCAAYPSGFQPYRNSHFNIPVGGRRLRRAFIADYLVGGGSYNHPTRRSSRAFRASSSTTRSRGRAARIYAGEYGARKVRTASRRVGEDHPQIGRESQIALYKASLGSDSPASRSCYGIGGREAPILLAGSL